MNQADSFQPQIPVSNSMPHRPAPTTALGRMVRSTYLAALTWAFTLFNSLRVVSYLPTMWAIQASGDSSQHSLWTWLTFLGGNVTMAVWLWENNSRRCNAAVAASGSNSLMCLAIIAAIVWTRL